MPRLIIKLLLATGLGLAAVNGAMAVSQKGTSTEIQVPAPVPAAAPASPPVWPMPVEAFLKGNFLERGDVVLTRRDWDVSSYLIRKATSSPFSHAALVFSKAGQEPGITHDFVIEAGTGGVDLTKLTDYINDKSSFVAIKRFPRPWFDQGMRARVRGVLLDKIKATYDYWIVWRVARSLWFGVQTSMQRETKQQSKREKMIKKYEDNDWVPPNDYICSGLVQAGFVETAVEYIRAGLVPPSSLNDVVFSPNVEKWLPNAEGWERLGKRGADVAAYFERQNSTTLRSVTPDDLARSEKLEWLYVIRGGMVEKVKTYDEVLGKVQ